MNLLPYKFALSVVLVSALHAQQMEGLKVSIVQGQGTVNSISHHVGGPIVVEVRDETGRIVPGARVQFSTPHSGPTGQVDGSHTFLAWTDTEGRARVEGFRPNSLPGAFAVTVEASYAGRMGTATFNESNSPEETEVTRAYYAKPNHKLRNTLIIAGVVGAAALAVGLSLALSGGAKAVVPPTPTSVSIGGIAVGGPQ